jgi:hypothetical protein
VEVRGGIKPEVELLLPVASPLCEHVGVHHVRLPAHVPQELEVDLVVRVSFRSQLRTNNNSPSR